MQMPDEPQCSGCRFWRVVSGEGPQGECRRYAPRAANQVSHFIGEAIIAVADLPLDAQPPSRLDAHQQDVGHAVASAPTPSGSRHGWAVVATHSRSEQDANDHLIEQGFETYLPLLVSKPLFPNYLFIWIGPHTIWRPVLNTPGVWTLLRSVDGTPHIARSGVIEALQATEALRRNPHPPSAIWRPGAPCRLAGGSLAGQDGVVLEIGKHNAIVAMLLFGHIRQVNVPVDALTAWTD